MRSLAIAASVAFGLTILGTPLFIKFLRSRGVGQEIREDGPEGHLLKRGTPTMGGAVFLLAAAVGYMGAHWLPLAAEGIATTWNGILALGAGLAMGLIGFLDDWLKFRNQRSLGLNKTGKIVGQLVVALAFAWLAQRFTAATTEISFVRPVGLELPVGLFTVWVLILFAGTANAVNLTDGLDGLAAGTSAIVFTALALIGFWQFRHQEFYVTQQAFDLAVVAAAYAGACAGFLWWNAAPAKIFMGDTGSLGLGGALAALALLLNIQLLLVVLGGLFVLEALSVIAQVFSFRVFGKRVLRMAPLHHHFELRGWSEITVTVRFWIIAAVFAALGLALFWADWFATGAIS